LAIVPATSSAQKTPAGEVARLVAVLNSTDAPVFDKAKACQRLAIVGDETAVPALAKLLADEKLSAYARDALEGIPGPASDAALREALSRLDGERLIGVLGSIGARRDAGAIDSAAKLLSSDDPAVAAAAARALGHIGTPAAADLLQKTLTEAKPEFRPAVGNACLICIQRLTKQGETDKAAALCNVLRAAELPRHITLAATYQAILAGGKGALPLLVELLGSEDEAEFRLALRAARHLGPEATGSLTARFDESPAPRQVLLILALGDVGDRAALPVILDAAKTGAKDVRVQAIRALGRFGEPAVVPALLRAAVEPDADISRAAQSSLAVLQSDEINKAIAQMLAAADPKTLEAAIHMAGQRKIATATPALLKLADHSEATIRLAAVKSLGSTIQLEDLPKLIARAVADRERPAAERSAAQEALKAACARMPDREACAAELIKRLPKAPLPEQCFLLETLAVVGGEKALAALAFGAGTSQDEVQDAATRLLGSWPTPDAAPVLLKLAKTLSNRKYRVRALRGYVRIARQLNMTPKERLEVCRNTLAIAERNDEKALVLEVLRRYPTAEGLALAASLLKDQQLREPACATIVAMAGGVAATAPDETEKALARVLEITTDQTLKEQAEKQIARARELARQRREEAEFTPLFDGLSLDGWQCSPGVFRVEDGAIVGGDLKKAIGAGNDFACTKKEYGDFELRLQFKLLGARVNGGVNLRSKRNSQSGVAAGYQADLGSNYWGCLFDEARRNKMLAWAKPKPAVKPGEWNDYRIRCEGKRIQLWVNGTQTVDYTEQNGNIPVKGIIALQVQANRPGEAWYRNIRIKEL